MVKYQIMINNNPNHIWLYDKIFNTFRDVQKELNAILKFSSGYLQYEIIKLSTKELKNGLG